MKFNIDFNNLNEVKLIKKDADNTYLFTFTEDTEDLVDPVFIPNYLVFYSLLEKNDHTYLVVPTNKHFADIYEILTDASVKSVKETLENFEGHDLG